MGQDLVATAKAVIKGLGGASNIKSSEPCITRIRCGLVDSSVVPGHLINKGIGRVGYRRFVDLTTNIREFLPQRRKFVIPNLDKGLLIGHVGRFQLCDAVFNFLFPR